MKLWLWVFKQALLWAAFIACVILFLFPWLLPLAYYGYVISQSGGLL